MLADILREGVQKFSDDYETRSIFQGFEGDGVALYLRGDRTVTFIVKDARPIILEGDVQNRSAIAEIDAMEFVGFIDGRTHFAELFTHSPGTTSLVSSLRFVFLRNREQLLWVGV